MGSNSRSMSAAEARQFNTFSVANSIAVETALDCGCQAYRDVFTYNRWKAQGSMSQDQRTKQLSGLLGWAIGGIYGALRGVSTGEVFGLSPWISIALFVVVGALIGGIVAERVWQDRSWGRIALYVLAGGVLDMAVGFAGGKSTLDAFGVDALEGALFGALIGANPEVARRGVRVGAIIGLAAGLAFGVMAIQNADELILRFGSLEVETGQVIYLAVTTLITVGVGAALGAIWTSLTARTLPEGK